MKLSSRTSRSIVTSGSFSSKSLRWMFDSQATMAECDEGPIAIEGSNHLSVITHREPARMVSEQIASWLRELSTSSEETSESAEASSS